MKNMLRWLGIIAIVLVTGFYLAGCGGSYSVVSGNFEFDSDSGTIIGYDNNASKRVTLPSTIDGIRVTAIGKNAFRGKRLISVTNLANISSIEEGAFAENQLTSVIFGSNITSIGASAFEDNKLETVTIPNSVLVIGENAFIKNQLTSVILGSKVTGIGKQAFAENYLSSITIPNSVTTIEKDAFSGNVLTSITIGPNKKFASNIVPNFAKTYDNNGKESGTYIRVDSSTWKKEQIAISNSK